MTSHQILDLIARSIGYGVLGAVAILVAIGIAYSIKQGLQHDSDKRDEP